MSRPRGPSWQAVRDRLHRRILEGHWRAGDRLPRDADLAREFGCARGTVQRAMRDLAEAGLVVRRRRGGTRLAEVPVRRVRLEIPILRQEVESRGAVWGYRLLDDRILPLPADVARELGLPEAVRWRRVRALHLADGIPFVLEDRWLDPGIADGVSFAAVSANEWLVRNVPYVTGTLGWSAVAAGPEEASLLGCAPGTPLLALDRTTRGTGGPITRVRLLHAPGFRLQARL
jgi:GntR family histidine utilization transcriptional repressor